MSREKLAIQNRSFISTWIIINLLFGFLSTSSLQAISVTAVVDSVLSVPKEDQKWLLWGLAYPPKETDTFKVEANYLALEAEFNRRKVEWLAQQAWLMNVYYKAVYNNPYNLLGLYYINKAIEEAHTRGWDVMEAGCTLLKGQIYYLQNKPGPAFEFFQKGYNSLREIGFENCPNIQDYMNVMGQSYYEFGDYVGAIQVLRNTLSSTDTEAARRHGINRLLKNTLALAYQKAEQYDSAIYFFKEAHDESINSGYTFWAALANGNLGYVFYLQGKYDEAIPLMEADYRASLKENEWNSAVNAAMILATMYLKKKEMAKAEFYLSYAKRNINYGSLRELAGFYKNMSTISRIIGDHNVAYAYIDSFLVYTDSLKKINDNRIINQAKLKVEVEQHTSELKLLEARRSREILIRNGALAILILSGMIVGLFYNRQRLKRKKELELADLHKARAEDELKNAQKELLGFTQMLKEKNELIENFRDEMDRLHQSGQIQAEERTEQLNRLLNFTILTEEDWKEFRMLFDKVYPGFFIHLKEKMTDLSPADTRLIALTKLQLAPKEMAAMLGLTYEAIKKSRQRLRKKINLPEEGSLDELVEII